MSGHFVDGRLLPRTCVGAAIAILSGGGAAIIGGGVASAAVNTLYVSTKGSDTGTCMVHPCKTIQFAENQAVAGDTIKVAAGIYHQTVAITKAIALVGAGAKSTKLDGRGLDTTGGAYGVVFVGTVGGAVSVSGFTITNPFPYTYTGGEPEIVALADQNASDAVVITNNIISEGTADANRGTDFPIGIDTFKNYAHTTISNNRIMGTFQGALLEDNGPALFTENGVTALISGTDNSTSPPTVYPAEGIFFLSDLSGSVTGQVATSNAFSSYPGYGLIMEAGYNNGNCTVNPCNGSISGTLANNSLALGGAKGAAGIALKASFSGNNLTATVKGNHGFVTRPDQTIVTKSTSGATLTVHQSNNQIAVH